VNEPLPPPVLRHLLARNLRRERSLAGIAQEAFALQVGLSRTYMSAIERSKKSVTLDTLERLAAGLNLPPWRLIFDEGVVGEEPEKQSVKSGPRRR
jgi:transcriptional regulator with XRE-family HTH domain